MSEKVTVKVERNILHLPAIALRGLVVFPNNLLHFEVGRDKSIAAVEWAVRNKSEVFLIAQKDMKAEEPKAEKLEPDDSPFVETASHAIRLDDLKFGRNYHGEE